MRRKFAVAGMLAVLLAACGKPSGPRSEPAPEGPTAAAVEEEVIEPLAALVARAEAGDATAQYKLAMRYLSEDGVESDPEKGREWLERAADQENIDALLRLAWDASVRDFRISYSADATDYFRRAAQLGNAEGASGLGIQLLRKPGTTEQQKALQWLTKGGNGGNVIAMVALYRLYSNPDFPFASKTDAASWWQRLEQLQTSHDLLTAAGQLENGLFAHQEEELAGKSPVPAEWRNESLPLLRRAAKGGHALAQEILAQRLFAVGTGRSPEVQEGVKWRRQAAEHGNVQAAFSLALDYKRGERVPQNYREAAHMLLIVANADDGGDNTTRNLVNRAMLNLGEMHEAGRGMPEDRVKALAWYTIAVAHGEPFSKWYNRDSLEKKLTADEVSEAQRLAAEWERDPSVLALDGAGSGLAVKGRQPVGSAFFVSKDGTLLTNSHVIQACKAVYQSGEDTEVRVISDDAVNDLALLSSDAKLAAVAVFRRDNDLKQGEDVVAYGFPLAGALADSGSASPGSITALAGLQNNSSHLQIDAPVQPGNSGGPLLDRKGRVVGVVVSKLDAAKVAAVTGDIPQNVNFAIRHSVVKSFLEANRVNYERSWPFGMDQANSDLARTAREFTVLLECER